MIRAWSFVLAATACGRIDFSDRSDAHTAVELCNGIDDNGDGTIDEGCACPVFDLTYPSSLNPTPISWTGSNYLALVIDNGEIALVSLPGGTVTSILMAGNFSVAAGVDTMVWTGTELAVVISQMDGLLLVFTFDASGVALDAPPILITTTAAVDTGRIAWAGDRFVVAYTDQIDGGVRLSEVSQTGTVLQTVTPGLTATVNGIAANATTYLVGATSSTFAASIIVIDRVTLQPTTNPIDLATVDSTPMQLVASGTQFAAIRFIGQIPNTVWLPLDGAGMPIGPIGAPPASNVVVNSTFQPIAVGYRAYGTSFGVGGTEVTTWADLDRSGAILQDEQTVISTMTTVLGTPSGAALGAGDAVATPFSASTGLSSRIIGRCLP